MEKQSLLLRQKDNLAERGLRCVSSMRWANERGLNAIMRRSNLDSLSIIASHVLISAAAKESSNPTSPMWPYNRKSDAKPYRRRFTNCAPSIRIVLIWEIIEFWNNSKDFLTSLGHSDCFPSPFRLFSPIIGSLKITRCGRTGGRTDPLIKMRGRI